MLAATCEAAWAMGPARELKPAVITMRISTRGDQSGEQPGRTQALEHAPGGLGSKATRGLGRHA